MKTAAVAASLALALLATTALAAPKVAAPAAPRPLSDAQLDQFVAGTDFVVIDEISDTSSAGPNSPDPQLINPWGLAEAPAAGPLWIADNGTGQSTLYNFADFSKIALDVTIHGPGAQEAAPTGIVFTSANGTDFDVHADGETGHSVFLFDTENGTIAGWAPSIGTSAAFTVVNQSASGAAFKGLAISPDLDGPGGPKKPPKGGGPPPPAQVLYATDFTQNKVEMFDGNFHLIGSFTDPSLPAGYAPFNAQVLNGKLYVTFALQSGGLDEVDGAGLGYVDVFTLAGQKIETLAAKGPLNAPWGLAIAPKDFGQFAGALLVGNFGNGEINAFDPNTGKDLGQVATPNKAAVSIQGLWALRTGPDGSLIFSSGPGGESHGLVGVILPSNAHASWAYQAHVVVGH